MESLAETILDLIPDDDAQLQGLQIERLRIELPLEFYVRRRGGEWKIEASAPTQRIKTAVLPVFHQVGIVIQADPEKETSD